MQLPREMHLPPGSSLGYTMGPGPGHSRTEVPDAADFRPTAGTLPVPEVHVLGTVTLFTRAAPESHWKDEDRTPGTLEKPETTVGKPQAQPSTPLPRDLPCNPFLHPSLVRPSSLHSQHPSQLWNCLCASSAHGRVTLECSVNPLEHDPGPWCSRV